MISISYNVLDHLSDSQIGRLINEADAWELKQAYRVYLVGRTLRERLGRNITPAEIEAAWRESGYGA